MPKDAWGGLMRGLTGGRGRSVHKTGKMGGPMPSAQRPANQGLRSKAKAFVKRTGSRARVQGKKGR